MNEATLAKMTFTVLRCRSQLSAKSLAASRHHDEIGHTSHGLTKHAPGARHNRADRSGEALDPRRPLRRAPRPIASTNEIGKTHVGETTVGVCGALISLR